MASLVAVLRGSFRYGLAGMVRLVVARLGLEGHGMARSDLAGMAWNKNKEEPYMVYQWKIPGIIPTDAQNHCRSISRKGSEAWYREKYSQIGRTQKVRI